MKPEFDESGLATISGNTRVFYYDPITREYAGWSDEYIHVGVSMPGNSTDIDPGEDIAGKVAVFTDGVWKLEEDHRGQTVWSTADGSTAAVDYIGVIRDGFTEIEPTTPYDKWDGEKWVTDIDSLHAADTASNEAKKTALINEATQFIAPLADAKEGGYIDDADIPVLTAWQKYRYALTKVDPSKPVWPDKPE
ncbi:tail fiber assembly protein [Escherichia coli O21:H28]|uniref:tail fiber assembly protein n=1 Tax=Escherichia coli TaxID=562 RepID=UPI000BB4AFC6|nr:tail fiber assembly protein [Escherichia coli]EEY7913672.1 tail fiber assembly protein [Escherichia coli O21:H28]EEZ5804652.1 tail fiber assembly protein [Escherichia coli O105]ATB82739.1 phage tail protein [Escherichia coli]EIP7739609.1 tail fiber assembly protein [Escherichia coli]MCD9287570.1 tail fiber assembly protein [Escherichia coli]